MTTDAEHADHAHQSQSGTLEPNEDGWYTARCGCGFTFGPAPDQEVVLDVLMEHAWLVGRQDDH